MTTIEAVNRFLISRHSKGLSEYTIRWYTHILMHFARHFPELPEEPEPIEEYLGNLDVTPERRHGYFRALKVFYRFIAKRRPIVNPISCMEEPLCRDKLPQILTPVQIRHLTISTHDPIIKIAINFLVDTGARLGELHSLTREYLQQVPQGFIALINGKTGQRIVPISFVTYQQLPLILPFHYHKDWLGRKISQAFKDAGLKGTAHTLRHTFATLWQGDELVLQKIMGHSSLATTQIYRQLRVQLLIEQHSKFTPLKMVNTTIEPML